ncbi:response regulator transcription factor [uncultured Paracoccus sp.]|uniref:response regulator transcription factor n=1 Tax=uncultured Paracoccus sp. TaxID=189685 RepID=UPI0026316C7A|nr:response regulator transcription factor [uncultured Paracoccus sp.]
MNVAAKDIRRYDVGADLQDVSRPTRLLIMDRQPIVVRGLTEALRHEFDFHICGVASSIAQASRVIQSERPDIVLSEIDFADGNLLSSIETFQAIRSGLKVLIFTSHSDCAYLHRAMRLDVSGFVLKNSDTQAIFHALYAARTGGMYVDPAILGRALCKQTRRPETLEAALSGVVDRLSEREIHTLRLVAFGHSIKEIARELGVSPKSIETYKARGCQKLDLASRASIVRYAVASGWFDDESDAHG